MIADIDKDVSASKLISSVNDTILYYGVGEVTDCDNLQFDLNSVFDWASSTNMFLTIKKIAMFIFALMGLPICPLCILTHR